MEILLAIVVVTAVIFFGALISMGNERQRKVRTDSTSLTQKSSEVPTGKC